MVLSFALCATFAFAQTNRVVGQAKIDDNRQKASQSVTASLQNGAAVDYKGSIFTKDDTLALFDFSMAPDAANANYSFGTVATGDMIGGQAATVHAQPFAGATWHRWVGVDSVSLLDEQGMESVYPDLGFVYGNPRYLYSAGNRMDTDYCSSLNGWVMLEMWSTEDGSGSINAYIALNAIPTTDVELFSVRFFQYLYHFAESTYVDYSTDGGATWNTTQINTNIAVNNDSWGYARFTMPSAAAAGSSVLLRIRVQSTYNRGYGYLWMLDDVAVTKNVDDQFTKSDQYWLAGAYQQMPQGLSLPVEWASRIINSGINAQTNSQLKLDNVYQGTATNIHTWNLGTVPSEQDSVYDLSTTASFPTSNAGDNFVTATLISDNLTVAYDTVLYMVNTLGADGSYTWARDNGFLNAQHSFLFGFDTSTYVDDEGTTSHYITENSPYYTNQGHSVYALYETGSTVPTDANGRPWVIRGVEYVVAVDEDVVNSSTPAQIAPAIVRDSSTNDGYVRFLPVSTGISSYTTNPATEYNDPAEMRDFGYYQQSDGYNTVRIDFSTQAELMPNQLYHVGYELLADARFAVAHTPYNTYTQWNEENQRYSYVPFRNNAQLKKYAYNFTYGMSRLAKGSDVLVYNPIDGYTWAGQSVAYYPMIRLLVGPRSSTKSISVTCSFEDDDEELGGVYSADLQGLCGSTLDVVEGASTRIYIIPETEVSVFTLTVDGDEIDVTTLPSEPINDGAYTGYYYEFNNVTADHQVVASFAVGIDDVAARVRMNLQPNPASSNVKLNIQGVTGYVNCALIDMSGRVVRSSRINAETENTINLNGLAKGAYFVRITNNDFTKVERLIVR